MTMLSGRMHWLMVGLALLVSAQDSIMQTARGQAPQPGSAAAHAHQHANAASYASYGAPFGATPQSVVQAMGGMSDAPMSIAMPGPPPMDVIYASGYSSCGPSCDALGGCQSCGGCNSCGGNACGGLGCGRGGILGGRSAKGSGGGRRGRGIFDRCNHCGGAGCNVCKRGLIAGILGGYTEGDRGAQRWYDIYAGTMALKRTSSFGGVSSTVQDPVTGAYLQSDVISTFNASGTPALRVSDLVLDDEFRWGLELVAALQTGVGSNLEVRYFGLNNWNEQRTASTVPSGNPTLFSIFSEFGTSPVNGFDDTDRSFIHSISYNSEIHNGEVNYRRRWVSSGEWTQGSFLFGLRHFDLDERFGFNAIGSANNTFTFNQLRYFEYATETRNQLTGVQMGGDLWLNVTPGIHVGVEAKSGIFGNHSEVESIAVSNSIPGAREHLQDGKTAFLAEGIAQVVYRLNYSWSFRAAYNVLYVDNVALATENFNTRDFSNALGGGNFTIARAPYIDVDGQVVYQGMSFGGEWLY